MPKNSRAKGKTGELELASLLRAHGFNARRGQQFAGGGDSPDIVHDMDGFHVECKRTEAFRLYDALAQAVRDRKQGEQALVFHRQNNRPWVVVMEANEFLALLSTYVFETVSREPKPTTLQDVGYAPGDYLSRCADCKEQHIAAKRAIRCKPCAEAKLKEAAE